MSRQPFRVLVHSFSSPTPASRAYESGNSSSKNALVFLGGLGDGPHTVPYVRTIARRLETAPELGYSVFEARMSSAFGGFGYKRLSDDVADVSALVQYLRSIGRVKIVLMGHSTGCQDCMEYTDYAKHDSSPIDGFILQGPVSDREAFGPLASKEEIEESLSIASKLIQSGKPDAIMPQEKIRDVFGTPITAYRWHSLLSPGGDDDYFSSDLSDEKIASFWSKFREPVLILPSGEDEYVPKSIDAERLIARWAQLSPPGIVSDLSGLIPGASHTVKSEDAQEWLADRVIKFLESLNQQSRVGHNL